MNKFYTFNLKDEHFLNAEISDEELMRISEEGIKQKVKPSKRLVNFLLNYSKALEVKHKYHIMLN